MYAHESKKRRGRASFSMLYKKPTNLFFAEYPQYASAALCFFRLFQLVGSFGCRLGRHFHALLLRADMSRAGGFFDVCSVARQYARFYVVAQLKVYQRIYTTADIRIEYRAADLYTPITVARHKVGGAYVHFFVFVFAEYVYARMLQKTSDDARYENVFCLFGYAGQQAAYAPDDHTDLDAGRACFMQLLKQVYVGEGVNLNRNLTVPTQFYLFVYELHDCLF